MVSILSPLETFTLFVLSVYTAQYQHVGGSSSNFVNRFSCSKICPSNNPLSIPLFFKARSRIECAAVCSRRTWCNRYSFQKNGSGSGSSPDLALKPCRLYKDIGSTCSSSVSEAPFCNKLTDGTLTMPQACARTSQRVLEVKNSQVSLPMENTSLYYLTSETSLKIQFVIGTSRFAVNANFYTLGTGIPATACASVLDSMASFNPLNIFTYVRSFCANGTQTVNPPATPASTAFSWDIQIPQRSTSESVFTTGGDRSALVSAVNNGFGMKLLFTKNNKVVHADVITLNKKTSAISAQVRLYEGGLLKIVSHLTGGSTETTVWNPLDSLSGTNSENEEAVWFSDSCWRLVYTNDPGSSAKFLTDLKNAVESGRRIRVKIASNDIVLLATPDYIGINSQGTVSAHVLRVLAQISVAPGGLVGVLNGLLGLIPDSTKPQWTHYMITHTGDMTAFTTDVGSSKYVKSSGKITVTWFEEVHNWTRIHTSIPVNSMSRQRLAAEVLNGSDVRVVLEVSGNRNWFSCDMVEVVDTDVKCHVSGQLSVSASDTSLGGLVGGLGDLLLGSQSSTDDIASECFVVSATSGSILTSGWCLWLASLPKSTVQQPQNVDWFVPM